MSRILGALLIAITGLAALALAAPAQAEASSFYYGRIAKECEGIPQCGGIFFEKQRRKVGFTLLHTCTGDYSSGFRKLRGNKFKVNYKKNGIHVKLTATVRKGAIKGKVRLTSRGCDTGTIRFKARRSG